MKQQDTARFWSKVEKTDSCWLWRGATFRRGYGAFQIDGQARKAHRIAYELTYGQIPDKLLVCHTCDNPPCVRPDHLWLGTNAENMHDRHVKGRTRAPYNHHHGGYKLKPGVRTGERNGRATVTREQVEEIRARYIPYVVTHKHLAREYNTTTFVIKAIISRRTWA